MATSTVSSFTDDNWQVISSVTPTGVNTYAFTGIEGYKTLMLKWEGLTSTSSDSYFMKFNNYGAKYCGGVEYVDNSSNVQYSGEQARLRVGMPIWGNNSYGYVKIENVLSVNAPKITSGIVNNDSGKPGKQWGAWLEPAAITRIDFYSDGSYNFSAGTITLLGIAG